MSFVNLHQHTHYSILDGFGSPEDVILQAKANGYPAVAITDHGVLYGAIEFYKSAKKHDIKPIIGCEVYIAPGDMTERGLKNDNRYFHLTLIAENNTGYQNLMKLVSLAHLEGFYYKPRIDYALLKKHSEGLIALSGCLSGHLSKSISGEAPESPAEIIKTHLEIFGKDNYFLELQDHPLISEQITLNKALKELAQEHNLPLVATIDSHYPCKEDAEAHDILLCMQTQSDVADENRMRFTGDFSLRSLEEMQKAFEDVPEALSNTILIADRCNVKIEFDQHLLPHFSTPNGETSEDYLRTLCLAGLKVRYGEEPGEEAVKRLDFELNLVNEMGFASYFLIVWDFVRFAKDSNIVVGPGRGSAAGSIIAYCLAITELDPLKYGLLFERFLNPERIEMPDVDIDFADKRRDEVLAYVIDKYGRDNVAQIITFGTMAAKAAIRDVGRSLGYPYAEVDAISKLVPPSVLGKYAPLAESIKDDAAFKAEYNNNPRVKTVIDLAVRLEGTVRHVGTHACAVVIAEKPLVEYTPLQKATGDSDGLVTQYSMKPIGDIGLLKMDFLGLKNLTVIEDTLDILRKNRDIDIKIMEIPLDDAKTFELLQKGYTTGVFQLESGGMKRYLKQLKPTQFEDIIAMGALYRPGPMEWIPMYILGKHDPTTVQYLDPSFEVILKETYGVAVYQEQILQIAQAFAGFTLGEADILRKAVGKKIPELLQEQKKKFIDGAVKKGCVTKFAEEVFEKVIEPFAGYGFNKAHAACYGLISYQTAYLKANYPAEFMSSLMTADFGNTDRIVTEIEDCEEMGIQVLQPDINSSEAGFAPTGENNIRFGLTAIKGVGEGPVNEIIEIRNKGGLFKSLEDFARRVPSKILNKKLIEALAYAGALDSFGNREQIGQSYEEISKYAKSSQEDVDSGQTDIFGIMEEEAVVQPLVLKKIAESSKLSTLQKEKEVLGMYVSGHPLQGLGGYLKRKSNLIADLSVKNVGKRANLCGLVMGTKRIMTKGGAYMMYFQLEDMTARIDATLFPRAYQQIGNLIVEGDVVKLEGKVEARRGELQFLVDSASKVSLNTMIENSKAEGTYNPEEKIVRHVKNLTDESDADEASNIDGPFVIKVASGGDVGALEKIKVLLLENKGEQSVEIHICDKENIKRVKVPFGVNITDKLKQEINTLLAI